MPSNPKTNMESKKVKKLNVCNDCGKPFNPPLSKKMLDYQKKHLDNPFVFVSCDNCIEKGHTLTDEELSTVVKVRAVKGVN